jgi:hypothetical protein
MINLFAVNFDMGIVGIFPYMLNLLKTHEIHCALTRKPCKTTSPLPRNSPCQPPANQLISSAPAIRRVMTFFFFFVKYKRIITVARLLVAQPTYGTRPITYIVNQSYI